MRRNTIKISNFVGIEIVDKNAEAIRNTITSTGFANWMVLWSIQMDPAKTLWTLIMLNLCQRT